MSLRLAAEPGYILMSIPGTKGTTLAIPGAYTNDTFVGVTGLTFGVNRELSESAKSGTADINIGVGELQVVHFTKGLDQASSLLARKAISGSSMGTVKIYFIKYRQAAGKTDIPYVHLAYALDNTFVKSWTISGNGEESPTEEVELWYNKIAMNVLVEKPDGTLTSGGKMEWDHVTSKPWTDSPVLIDAEGKLPSP